MQSRDFCYWLQGYFEVSGAAAGAASGATGGISGGAGGSVFNGLSPAQVGVIKNHLALVFKHEIDPSMGGAAHQNDLNSLHTAANAAPFTPPLHGHGGMTVRC